MALKRPALPDLVNEYKNEISLARKKFRTEQPQSSKGSRKSDFTQILFYESFEHYPIILEGGFKIYPKRWALAFLQPDIRSIAEILCESLFTEQELQTRNSSQDGARTLPTTKRIAIQRAAKWLMNKNQDPWNYKAGPWPNPEEKQEIEAAFQSFSRIDPKSAYYLVESDSVDQDVLAPLSPANEGGDVAVDVDMAISGISDVDSEVQHLTETADSSPPTSDPNYQDIYQDLRIDCEYYTSFDNAIKLGQSGQRTFLGNTAQTAKLLTKMVVPDNEDVFVDAVQFSNGRWAAAVDAETVEDIAEPLFRKYYKTEFERYNIPFKSLDDFSPPKVLALLRAVAWIKKLKSGCWDDIYGFDSSITEHNLFPTVSEIHRIYNYLSIKYGEGPCRPETCEPEMTQDTPPTSSPTMAESVSRSTCIVSPTPIVVTQPSPTQAQPVLQSQLGGLANATNPGHSFTTTVWREALRRFKLDEKNGMEKAGKYLFEEAFTGQEIMEENISGRGGRGKFTDIKINAIFNALAEMKGVISGQGTIPLTKSEKKEMTTKILVEHSNYLRRKLKQTEAVAALLASNKST